MNKFEEDAPDAVDIPMAILPNTEEIVLLQMDGLLSKKEWLEARGKAFEAIKQVYELQKQALLKKYEQPVEAAENGGVVQ